MVITFDQLESLTISTQPVGSTPPLIIEPSGIRFVLLNEFCTTERRFVSSLSLVSWKFAKPLLGLPPNPPKSMIAPAAVRAIFGSLEALALVVEAFVELLESRISESGPSAIVGDAFDEMSSKVAVFVQYSEAYPVMISTLTDAMRKSPALARFIERTEKSPHCSGRTLRSFLKQPLQRLQGYTTFLSDFASATAESHPDYAVIGNALERIKASSVSFRKHDSSDLEKIISVEQRLKGQFETLVGPGRKYIREARLTLLQIGDKPLEIAFDVVLFLLNDLLVIAKVAKQDRCKLLDRLPLSEVIVGTAEEESVQLVRENCFKIQRCTVGSTVKSGYVLAAPTLRDQKEIVDAILQTQTTLPPVSATTTGKQK
jgi:hypothetical protein